MQGKLTGVSLVAGLMLIAAAMTALPSDGSEPEFGDAPAAAPHHASAGEHDDRESPGYEPRDASPEVLDGSDRSSGDSRPAVSDAGHPLAADPAATDPEAAEPRTAEPEGEKPTSEAVVARPARLEDVAAERPRVRPARIALDRLGIRAPVDSVGLESDGGLEIPADVTRAGWYEPTAMAGAAHGSTVVTAHVDSRQQGAGAFFPLRQAVPGDRITVSDTSSRTAEYEVAAATSYDKDELPIAELFRADGEHRLVLITCGGAFDEQTRSYEENLVVIATVVD